MFSSILKIFGLRPRVKSFSINTLPGFDQTPHELVFIGNNTIEYLVSVEEEAYLAFGVDAAEGLSNIASDSSRRKLQPGVAFSIFKDNDKNFYIRAAGTTPNTAEGLQITEYQY